MSIETTQLHQDFFFKKKKTSENRFNRSWFLLAFSQFIFWFDFANVNQKICGDYYSHGIVWFHFIHALGDQCGFGFVN